MANEEHLAILRRGVEEWNRWREEKPKVRPDLREVELRDADLGAAYLSNTDLFDAHLGEARLSEADLSGANLSYAYVNHTRLLRANLHSANLFEASLIGADLRGADLRGADLRGAHLGGDLRDLDLGSDHLTCAKLHGARFRFTTVGDVDLRQVEGLDSVRHQGPSTIGTIALELSRGQIPEIFLKGCGLADWEIEAAKLYNPKLTEDEITTTLFEISRIRGEQPIMHTRLFISYSHADSEFVETLEPLLDDKGVRYWRDVHDMRAGRMEKQIDRGIALNPLVLLILSENSARSDWVEDEATKARELERKYRDQGQPRDVLCPIALDDSWKRSDWPRVLRRQIEDYAILDFSGWRDPEVLREQFGKLYEGLVLNYKA